MKNIIIILLFAFTNNVVFSQDFKGTAIYEWKTSSEDFKKTVLADPKMDPTMRKIIEARMGKMFNKTFVLNFDKNNSVYKKQEKISVNNESDNASWSPYGVTISYFKNLKTKQIIDEKNLMSKIFNVQDSLINYKWKLESDNKQIGSYFCNKATAIIAVTKKERLDYEEEKAEQEKSKTQFIKIEEPKDKIITAWYTPDIPVNHGPETYWGLPGLILEINDGKSTIICSKIVLNPKEKLKIKISKGKEISKKEYDKIVVKKTEEVERRDFTK